MMTGLFWNVVQVGLTASAVLLPALLVRAVLRRRYPAQVLVIFWACVVLRLLIPVQVTLAETPIFIAPNTELSYEVPAQTEAPPSEAVSAPPSADQSAPSAAPVRAMETVDYGAVLSGVWLAGALGLLLIQLTGYGVYLHRLRRTAARVEDQTLCAAYAQARQSLGVRRSIPLLVSPEADGPMLCGLFRPRLILPARPVNPADAPFIFRHELTHYRRHDLALKLALVCVRAMHWFNPLIWLLARTVGEDIELACDQTVTRGLDTAGRRAYGACILNNAAGERRARLALTTCFTDEKESLKTRLAGLFDARQKKRGVAFLLAGAMTVVLVGGCFAVGGTVQASGATAEALSAAAETYAKAVQNRDGKAVYDLLRAADQPGYYRDRQTVAQMLAGADPIVEGAGAPNWVIGTSSPRASAYAIAPEPARMGAYVTFNWQASASPDTRSYQWLRFVREDGALRLVLDDWTDQSEARDLETFTRLYGALGLPAVAGSIQQDPPASWIERLLGLTGGTLRALPEAAGAYEYTFANGQAVRIETQTQGGLWSFAGWQATRETPYAPDDATAKRQMDEMTRRWIAAQSEGLTAQDAETLLGSPLSAQFAAIADGYADPAQAEPFRVNNLPSGAVIDGSTYTLDVKTHTATVRLHAGNTCAGGMTQTQTLYFGWENGQPRLIDRTVTEVMALDDTPWIQTAADAVKAGVPAAPLASDYSAKEAVSLNWKLYGGRFESPDADDPAQVTYVFADGTQARFTMTRQALDADTTRYVPVSVTAVQTGKTGGKRTVERIAVANQWARGYLDKSAACRVPVMSADLRTDFIAQQEKEYGLLWFWRIGWGSSPSVRDWVVTDVTDQSATVVYRLSAGGEDYRYAETLTFGTEDGRLVVTDFRCAADTIDADTLTKAQFRLLYATGLPLPEPNAHQLAARDEALYAWVTDPVQVVRRCFGGLKTCTVTLRTQTAREATVAVQFSDDRAAPGANTLTVTLAHPEGFPDCWTPSGLDIP